MRANISALAGPSGKMTESLGKAASATSGLAGAMSGATGQSAALIGAADNLTQAFLVGGPLALGIAGVATGLGLMSSKAEKAKRKAVELSKQLREDLAKRLDDVAKKASDAARAVEEFGMSGIEVDAARAFDELTGNIDRQRDARERLAEAEGRAKKVSEELAAFAKIESDLRAGSIELSVKDRSELQLRQVAMREEKRLLDARNEAGDTLVDTLKKEIVELELLEPSLRSAMSSKRQLVELTKEQIEASKREAEARQAAEALRRENLQNEQEVEDAYFRGRKYMADLEENARREGARRARQQALAEREQRRSEMKMAWEDFDQEQKAKLDSARAAEDARLDVLRAALEEEKRIAAEREALYRQVDASIRGMAEDGLSAVVSSTVASAQILAEGIATGEEMAAERAGVAFLQSTGNQLVGIGTKAIIEGAIISANPLTPGLGAPMIGLGLAAVATGIGMGAAGAAGANAISQANSGGIGQGVADTSSRGASSFFGPSRSSSSSSSREQQTVVYNFNAPVFGDMNEAARTVSRLQRRASEQLLERRLR